MEIQKYDLSDTDFERFKELIHKETGIFLSDQKKKLLVARLSKRLRALGINTFTDYYNFISKDPNGVQEMNNLINRITTNKTDFFRELHHFDFLKNIVFPQLVERAERSGNRKVRIWSAGCSSGEEPYSIALTTAEFFSKKKGWDIKILATDLDTEILHRASQGIYPTQLVAPVPTDYLKKYFTRTGTNYTVNANLKSMIAFRRLNFIDQTFPMKNPFDIIFCRNVIIYFDLPTKTALMNKFHHYLNNDGYIFIGHSESLMSMKEKFKYVKNTIYKKV